MRFNTLRSLLAPAAIVALAVLPAPARADEGKKVDWPAAVKATVEKEYPGAKLGDCFEEKEDGKTTYTCKVETKDAKKLELDLTPAGKLIGIEEYIPVDAVPAAVIKAFAAKYPKAKATAASKETKIDEKDDKDRKTFYELAFEDGSKKKEATFAADGTFVEEEDED